MPGIGSWRATAFVACAAVAAGVAYQPRIMWDPNERAPFAHGIYSFYTDVILEKTIGYVYSVSWGLLLGECSPPAPITCLVHVLCPCTSGSTFNTAAGQGLFILCISAVLVELANSTYQRWCSQRELQRLGAVDNPVGTEQARQQAQQGVDAVTSEMHAAQASQEAKQVRVVASLVDPG